MENNYTIFGLLLIMIGVVLGFIIEDYYRKRDTLYVDNYGSEKGFLVFIIFIGLGIYLMHLK